MKNTTKQLRPKTAQHGPKRASRITRLSSLAPFGPILSPYWAHLGLSWALLSPSWVVQEGILGQTLGEEGLTWGLHVARSQDAQNINNNKIKEVNNQCFWPIPGGGEPYESLQNGCLEVLLWSCRLEGSSLEAMLASRVVQEAQVEPKMAKYGPEMGPRGLPGLSCQFVLLYVAPFWAHLGSTLGYLGPSLARPGGSRRAS